MGNRCPQREWVQGHLECLSSPGCTQVSAPKLLPQSILWPWPGLVAGPAGQPGLLLATGGSLAVSTLQQPPRRHLEARKCWLLGLQGGLQALLILGTAQLSPFPCSEQRHEGRRKPLLMSALTQWVLHLLQLLLETIPPWQEPRSLQESESWANMGKEATSG